MPSTTDEQKDDVYANRTDHEEGLWENIPTLMATLPRSPPHSKNPPEVTSKRTRQSTRLKSLTTRSLDNPQPIVNVNPATSRGSGPHKEKFHSYLGVVAREKIPIVHANWSVVPDDLKTLIWEDILDEKKKVMSTIATRWRQFKSSLNFKFVYGNNDSQQISYPTVKYGLENGFIVGIRKKAQEIQKYNDYPHVLSRRSYELLDKKLMDKKRKRQDQQDEFTENPTLSLDPPSHVSRHLKWKMARTKCYGQITSQAAKQIADKIDSLEEQATQGSFVPHGRQDILNTAIGQPEHLGHVCVAGTGVTISQYFGQVSHASSTSSPSIYQQQLAEIIGGINDEIRKEVEEEHKQQQEAWRREVEEQHSRDMEIMKQELKQALKIELSHISSHQSALIEAPKMKPLAARVSIKGSYAAPEAQGLPKEPSDVDVDRIGLFVVEDESTLLVAPYIMVKVVTYYHPDAEVPYPTSEVRYMNQAVGTFITWLRHLVRKVTDEVVLVSNKPPPNSVEQPDRANVVATADPLGELVKELYVVYQKPMELSWDGAKFGIPNSINGFFITHADVTEIILGDKYLNISILQLWMMFMNDWTTSLFMVCLSPSLYVVQRTRVKNAHWQLLVLCPRKNIVVWFCSVRRKPDVHIRAIVNNAMKKISTTFQGKENGPPPQWIEPKSHVQAEAYECGYYVMH
ncbi:hypothetical protein GmHk_20G056868 [Glycine max]|nr:hypothetical protein GmHk_20G056868 [Glycine max]